MNANLYHSLFSVVLFLQVVGATKTHAVSCWGRLANPGFDGERIKTTLFFAGQANDGAIPYPYECPIGPNLGAYTLTPAPTNTHLNWTNPANQNAVLSLMMNAGINVVSMSSWGEDFLTKTNCADGWVTGIAPMQTSFRAHDELFTAATDKHLLIVPFIETRANWAMRDEFPRWTDGRVSPGLISQITNLIHRYLQKSDRPEWANKWAQVYDHNGMARYAVVLIHAVSNRLSPLDPASHAAFAAGFDLVANEVAQATGVQVGFFIDALPFGASVAANFNPSSIATGPYLSITPSILGIQCFIPEVFRPHLDDTFVNDAAKLSWKRDFIRGWFSTGIPVLVDAAPGYDAHIAFPRSHQFGYSDFWLQETTALLNDYGRAGMAYNSWNGYTEGMVGVPTKEKGDSLYDWLTSLNSTQAIHVDHDFASAGWGTISEPFQTVATASAEACERDVIQIRSGSYPGAITILKPLTLQAEGGPVTIGN